MLLLACALFMGCSYDDYYADSGTEFPSSTSIFVGSDRHENGAGNNLPALLQTVTNNFTSVPPSLVFLGGDYVGKGPSSGVTGLPVFDVAGIKDEVTAALGNKVPYEILLTYGSHDQSATEGYSAFFSGPRACTGYYVYGISFAQMYYATDSATTAVDTTYTTTVVADSVASDTVTTMALSTYSGIDLKDPFGISAASATRRFTSWIESLSDNAPIVIMSHIPLHANREDNSGAYTWFRAISEAAKTHDILVLFGHNHTMEELYNQIDTYNYLLTPGDSISVQAEGKVYREKLNFTYGNAGYIKSGCSSLITFTDVDGNKKYDKMTIRRYSLNGVGNGFFGMTGKENPFTVTLSKSR